MLVIPWGKIAARKIYKSLGEDDIIKSVIRLIEKRPDPSIQFSTLIDCEDVCLRQVNFYSFSSYFNLFVGLGIKTRFGNDNENGRCIIALISRQFTPCSFSQGSKFCV